MKGEGRGRERKDIKIHKGRVIHSTKWMTRALGHNSSQGFNIEKADQSAWRRRWPWITPMHTHNYPLLPGILTYETGSLVHARQILHHWATPAKTLSFWKHSCITVKKIKMYFKHTSKHKVIQQVVDLFLITFFLLQTKSYI